MAGGCVVRDSFGVQAEQSVLCHTCGTHSTRWAHPERSLALTFPEKGDASQECTLYGCLSNYFQPTLMTAKEQYQCETCAKQRGIDVKEATSDATKT